MSRASLRSDSRLRGRGRHRSPWTPRRLAPRAWYDAELGQPKYVGYVQLNGGSTDNISTPDSALNSFSNDIEVIMRVRPDDWTTGATQTLCGKYLTTGNQRSWRFYVSAAGAIGLTASVDGTAVTTIAVTPTTPFVDATWIWLRLRLDLTNGANSVGTIDTAADTGNNYTIPTSWTANGTNTGTTLAGIYDGTGLVEIGAFNSGTSERLAGRVGRCIVKAGFDGTTTSDFNADNCYGPGYAHADGYYWALGILKIYDRSGNNVAPAVFGSGTNQPLWLPWRNIPSVHFESSTANNLGASDRSAFDWATGFTLSWLGTSPGSGSNAIAGQDNGISRAWYVRQNGTAVNVIVNGTTIVFTSELGYVANRWQWWRVRFTPDNGGGLSECWLETSLETGQDEPTTWTTLSSVTQAILPVPDSTANFTIGAVGGVGAVGNGELSRVIARIGSAGTGTPVVDFYATDCNQSTGCTDRVGNVFAVSRNTTGRKTVVQSGTAKSARSVILLGTDDWIDVPVAAVPALDTFAAASSIIAIFRRWHNPGTVFPFTTKANVTTATLGFMFRTGAGAGSTDLLSAVSDGAAFDTATVTTNALGTRAVLSSDVSNTSPFVTAQVNGGTEATDTARATTVSTSTGGAGRIGAALAGTGVIDMEFEGLITLDDAVSAIDHSRAVEYYNGGL